MKKLSYTENTVIRGWAIWFIQPNQNFLYTKTFKTRKEAREYWAWKTNKNPKYKVVKVKETVVNTITIL